MARSRSIVAAEPALDAPLAQHGVHIGGDEVAGAVVVVTLRQQIVVVGEGVPHIGDEREPGRGLGRARLQAAAVERVVDDGAELMRRNARRQAPQRGFDVGACGQGALAACMRWTILERVPFLRN